MRIAYLAYGFLLFVSVACQDGPTGPDPTLVIVEGSTATYQDTDLRLERFNLSWYPEDDSPFPSEGDGRVPSARRPRVEEPTTSRGALLERNVGESVFVPDKHIL